MVLLQWRGFTTIKKIGSINGEERGGDDSEVDNSTARATGAGATRSMATTAATAVTMTPNGDEDNKDRNSKNNNKATMKPTMTTEEVSLVNDSQRQSRQRTSSSPRRRHCAHGCLVATHFCRIMLFPGR